MSLSGSCCSISKHCGIVTLHDSIYEEFGSVFEDVVLIALFIEYEIESETLFFVALLSECLYCYQERSTSSGLAAEIS